MALKNVLRLYLKFVRQNQHILDLFTFVNEVKVKE